MMARAEAPADHRNYVRMSIDLPLNPKLARMGNPVAAWTYVTSVCYAGSNLTDGHFPTDVVIRLAGVPKATAKALVRAGLWHLPGHDCDRCEQPLEGDAVIHDYLQHQRSAAEARGLTEKRSAAGRAGAAKRWNSEANGKPIANAMAIAEQTLWQTDGNRVAEIEIEEEPKSKPMSATADAAKDFDEWWAAVPRKDGKTPAKAAYVKARRKPGVTRELLLEGIRKYAARMAREQTAREKIKMPQGWLNDQRWEDDPTPVAARVDSESIGWWQR